MNTMLGLLNLGGGEIILILSLVLILFGAKRLPELARGLGQGIREFKKATHSASEGMLESMAGSPPAAPKRPTPAIPNHSGEQLINRPVGDISRPDRSRESQTIT